MKTCQKWLCDLFVSYISLPTTIFLFIFEILKCRLYFVNVLFTLPGREKKKTVKTEHCQNILFFFFYFTKIMWWWESVTTVLILLQHIPKILRGSHLRTELDSGRSMCENYMSWATLSQCELHDSRYSHPGIWSCFQGRKFYLSVNDKYVSETQKFWPHSWLLAPVNDVILRFYPSVRCSSIKLAHEQRKHNIRFGRIYFWLYIRDRQREP